MNALLSAPNPKRVSALPEGLFSDIANEGDVIDSLAGLGLSGQSMPKLNEVSITDDDRLFWDMDDDDMAILTKAKSISRPVSTSAAFSTSNLGHSLSPFRPESSDIHIQPDVLNGKLLDLSLMDRSSATIARTIARPSTSFLPDVDKSSFLTSSVIRPGSVPVQGSFVSHDFAAEPIFQDFLRPNANNFEVSSSGADNSIEMMVVRCCISILSTAADHSLKAVELANTLRARVGTELLSTVREHYGGLLSLLERHVFVFKVDRIAKNDKVTLIGSLGGDPSSVLAGGSTAAGLMAEQLNSRSPPPRGSSQSPGLPTVSRCLHIGNVPCHLTEYQLKCEFGLYGTVENLKLVSHKNSVRRFAFVTYHTLEEAYHAKQCLGKLHPWKSAISYARKDYQTSGSSSSNNNNNNIGGWHIASSASPQLPPYAPHMDSSSSLYAPPPPPPLLYSHQPLPHPMLYPGSPPLFESVSSPPLPQGPSTPSTGTPATAAVSGAVDPILQRLCDHTYVPTQPWPVDVVKDGPYCEAIVAQLMQFGGYTTVSKLRGFLRFKVAASDNIKSVPLKALLCAYPSLFSVQNNFVSLVAVPPLNLNQQQQQQVASHIPLNDF